MIKNLQILCDDLDFLVHTSFMTNAHFQGHGRVLLSNGQLCFCSGCKLSKCLLFLVLTSDEHSFLSALSSRVLLFAIVPVYLFAAFVP